MACCMYCGASRKRGSHYRLFFGFGNLTTGSCRAASHSYYSCFKAFSSLPDGWNGAIKRALTLDAPVRGSLALPSAENMADLVNMKKSALLLLLSLGPEQTYELCFCIH